MLDLPQVTLAAFDAPNLDLTIRAMKICLKEAKFGDAVLLSELEVGEQPFRVERTTAQSTRKLNGSYLLNKLTNWVNTSHVLYVQWDSHIINPEQWQDQYLDFDWIGARWPWHTDGHNIGCGGFCLMSKKLLDILAKTEFPHYCELDDYVCRVLRPHLEKDYGIKFGTEEIAKSFAYERDTPLNLTFGFHGLFNMWRHTSDEDMQNLIPLMADYVVKSLHYVELMLKYISFAKYGVYKCMFKHLKHVVGDVEEHLQSLFPNDDKNQIYWLIYIGEHSKNDKNHSSEELKKLKSDNLNFLFNREGLDAKLPEH